MNNNIILLKKLIDETNKNIIIWNHIKVNDRRYTKWEGIKKITENKRIYFVLTFDNYEPSISELKVFLVNDINKKSDIIFEVDPGIFSFRSKKYLEKLIDTIDEIGLKKYDKYKEITNKNITVEPIKSIWEEEADDDINDKKYYF